MEVDAADQFKTTLNDIVNGRDGSFVVMARDLKTVDEVPISRDTLVPTAIVFKVPVMVKAFRNAHLDLISLHDRHELREEDECPGLGVLEEMLPVVQLAYSDLAVLMIISRDNTATDLCLDVVGVNDANATTRNMGLTNSDITMGCKELSVHCAGIEVHWPSNQEVARSFEKTDAGQVDYDDLAFKGVKEKNVTTIRDMVNLLQILYEGSKLPQEDCYHDQRWYCGNQQCCH